MLVNLEIGAVVCALETGFNPVSGAVVVVRMVVVLGSVVGGWKVVTVLEIELVVVVEVVVRPAETIAGAGVSPAKGPRENLLSGEVGDMSLLKAPQVSEAEPGFLEIGDAS